jgi:hypothetical protein
MRLLIVLALAVVVVVVFTLLRFNSPSQPALPGPEETRAAPRSSREPPPQAAKAPEAAAPKEDPVSGGTRPPEPDTQAPLIEQVIRPEAGHAKADVQAACLALRKLTPEELTEKEREALRWSLFERAANETIRNDTANVLLRAKDRLLAGGLLAQLADLEQTPVWRNYCAQHLAVGYREFDRRPEVVEALFKAAGADPDPGVRDCCLLHLSRIAEADEWSASRRAWHERAAALAKRFLGEEKRTDVERISGIHAAPRLGLREEAPRLIGWLNDPRADLGVRKASTTALGALAPLVDEAVKKEIEAALATAGKDHNRLLRIQAERALAALKGGGR